jgi:hypothetical protein
VNKRNQTNRANGEGNTQMPWTTIDHRKALGHLFAITPPTTAADYCSSLLLTVDAENDKCTG